MNQSINITKGDRIVLPATPGTAKVNPSMWPTGYRVRYGETSRFYLHAGLPVTVVSVAGPYRDGDPVEVLVRHLPSKSTVLMTIDQLGHQCGGCGTFGALNDLVDDPDGGVMWLCDPCYEYAVEAEEAAFNLQRAEDEMMNLDLMREDHEAMKFDQWYQEQKENRS